jgi:ABC-2 type transport system ATP-binding protein
VSVTGTATDVPGTAAAAAADGVTVAGLHKTYGEVVALDGVDLHIAHGEVLGLLGLNGAGKTTLLSILAGLRRADSGQVLLDRVDVCRRPQLARQALGFAPQDLGLYAPITARENLRVFGELAGLRRTVLSRRVEEVVDALELGEFVDRPVHSLSGGEKRRVHVGVALIHRPRVVLLDEPTAGVDASTRARLIGVVRDIAAQGTAVCYSSHYIPEIEDLGGSVAVLDRGRIVARGDLARVVTSHGFSGVELTFEGAVPAAVCERAVVEGSVARVAADRPATAAAELLARLGPEASRLRSVEIVHPNLESAFIELTRRRPSDGACARDGAL